MKIRADFVCVLLLLLPLQLNAQQMRADSAASYLYVVTHRTGLLSFLGHEHAIVPAAWSATICYDSSDVTRSSAEITADARTLVIDSDEARRLAGLGRGPNASQRAQIQSKMLDADHLDAQRHSELRLETISLGRGAGGTLTAQSRLTIHGITRAVTFPVTIEPVGTDDLRINARLTVRQTDYGIKPESVRGVVKVADPVDIHALLIARPTGRSCN